MKKSIVLIMSVVLLVSCGNKPQQSVEHADPIDASIVNVYYFHGKQRCKTCVAVGDVARETVSTSYANNPNVIFTEINTSEKEFDYLVEKYQVSWNALIIAKGDEYVDITEQAFATAVGKPEVLRQSIEEEVNKKL